MKRPTRRKSPAISSRAKSSRAKSRSQASAKLKIAKPVTKAGRAVRAKLSRAKRTYDMASASAETIGYRSAMIGRELASPTGFADPEFATMGHEKVLAAGEAATAMLRRLGSGHRIWTDFWFQQMQRTLAVLPQLATSGSPARALQVASVSAGTLMSDYFALWTKATSLSEAVADAGARPIHRTVMANAKRLAKAA